MNIKQKAAERIKRLSEKLGCDKYNLKRLIKGLVPSALSLAVVLAGAGDVVVVGVLGARRAVGG